MHYRTLNGTGIAGLDFTAVSGDLKWLEGDMSPKKIIIPILDPPIPEVLTFEPTTDFNVVLENQAVYSGPYKQPVLDFIPEITANIVVEESRGKGFFRFENLQYNVSENDGTIRLGDSFHIFVPDFKRSLIVVPKDELWVVDGGHGVWIMVMAHGLWLMDHGSWLMDHEP